jgi:hypothetical protein
MNWWAATTQLILLTNMQPRFDNLLIGQYASATRVPGEKARLLKACDLCAVEQTARIKNPNSRVTLQEMESGQLLERYATSLARIQSGDYPRFGRCFREMPYLMQGWEFQQSTVSTITEYRGHEHIVLWENGKGFLSKHPGAYVRGTQAWSRQGILVSSMRRLPVTLYTGELFDNNTAVNLPHDPKHLNRTTRHWYSMKLCENTLTARSDHSRASGEVEEQARCESGGLRLHSATLRPNGQDATASEEVYESCVVRFRWSGT